MTENPVWFAMISAPRDGSIIIALDADLGGVCLIRWGENTENGEDEWFEADWSTTFQDWAGWLPAPQFDYENHTAWMIWHRSQVDKKKGDQ